VLPDFVQDLFKSSGFTEGNNATEIAAAFKTLQSLKFGSPETEGFDSALVQDVLAKVAAAQWCSAEDVPSALENDMAMQDVRVVSSAEAGVEAVLGLSDDKLIVSFRGSHPSSLTGGLKHLSGQKSSFLCAECTVGDVYLTKYNALRTEVASALEALKIEFPKAKVFVTGAGEGGALATLFAVDSAQDATLVTFGSPRVGNAAFAEAFAASPLADSTFRVTHWRDPVPHMPQSATFVHVGQEVFYNQDSSDYKVCAGESAECAGATSVFNFLDHFNYMGKDTLKCMLGDALDSNGELTLLSSVLMTVQTQGSDLMVAPGTPVPAGFSDLLSMSKYFDAPADANTAMRRPGYDLPKEVGFDHEQAVAAPIGTMFQAYPNNFDHTLVAELAHFPYIAFCEKEQVEKWDCGPLCDRMNATSDIHYIAGEDSTQAAAVIAVNHDAQIMVFFKAGMPKGGLSDFEFMAHPEYCNDCKVHRGLYAQYLAIHAKVLNQLNIVQQAVPSAKVTVMGWSMGGALATYGALAMSAKGFEIDMVLTMGMPRAGNKAFVDYYHSTKLQKITWRITHNEDPMTHLPPTAAGWHHVGTEVFYNEDFTHYRICDGSGEDPYCSAGKPGLKLNADHFSYFSVDYSVSATACGGLGEFGTTLQKTLPSIAEVFAWIVPLVIEMEHNGQ